MDVFSKRIGISAQSVPIVTRYDVTMELRDYLLLMIGPYISSLKTIRGIVCTATKTAPDRGNWCENDFMKDEIVGILENCPWYNIYDIIELVYANISHSAQKDDFEKDVNDYFLQKGIGWKMTQGTIEYRGDDAFEEKMAESATILSEAGLDTSANELKEALKDLSKKPDPEITGAIQHSVAALECVAREVATSKETLGKLIKDNPDIVPRPTDEIVSKIFGYASEWGRHLKEGRNPDYEEAELIVHLSASFCSYLSKKHFPISKTEEIEDFPF